MLGRCPVRPARWFRVGQDRWVPLLPRESAKKTFNVGDRSLPERHALFPRRIDAWRAKNSVSCLLLYCHPLGVHGDNLLIKAAKTPLSFADKLRIKLPSAIPRHFDFQLTILAQEGLFTGPVAVIFGLLVLVPGRGLPFLVAKVVGHLGPKNPLVDPFG